IGGRLRESVPESAWRVEGAPRHPREAAVNERDIFVAALAIEGPAERADYLDRACAGDPALRRRLGVLLDAHGQAGRFLEKPAAEQIIAALPDERTRADTTPRPEAGADDP